MRLANLPLMDGLRLITGQNDNFLLKTLRILKWGPGGPHILILFFYWS